MLYAASLSGFFGSVAMLLGAMGTPDDTKDARLRARLTEHIESITLRRPECEVNGWRASAEVLQWKDAEWVMVEYTLARVKNRKPDTCLLLCPSTRLTLHWWDGSGNKIEEDSFWCIDIPEIWLLRDYTKPYRTVLTVPVPKACTRLDIQLGRTELMISVGLR